MAHPMGFHVILPELTGNDHLAMDYQIPSCGNIHDQNGDPIALQSDAYAIGVIPSQLGQVVGTVDVELGKLYGRQNFDIHPRSLGKMPRLIPMLALPRLRRMKSKRRSWI